MVNLCIVNEDLPQCNEPRKTIKACPGVGSGALSLTWRVATQPLFLHRISVVRVYVYIATTMDPGGHDLHHLAPRNRDPGLRVAVVVNTPTSWDLRAIGTQHFSVMP